MFLDMRRLSECVNTMPLHPSHLANREYPTMMREVSDCRPLSPLSGVLIPSGPKHKIFSSAKRGADEQRARNQKSRGKVSRPSGLGGVAEERGKVTRHSGFGGVAGSLTPSNGNLRECLVQEKMRSVKISAQALICLSL